MRSVKQRRLRRPKLETLERRSLLAADLIISEFLARNNATLWDEDGDSSDWIEISNVGDETAVLKDYALTDDIGDLNQWRFPQVGLPAGDQLVVFASGKNRQDPNGELHTNFRLNGGGEYLALVKPDGQTVVQDFAPEYPPQAIDASYGIGATVQTEALIRHDTASSYAVSDDPKLIESWFTHDFDDADWLPGTASLGFDQGSAEQIPFDVATLALAPVGYWRFEETRGITAANSGSADDLTGRYVRTPTRTAEGPGSVFGLADSSATGFDGIREAVTTQASTLSNLGEFTISGFIRPGDFSGERVGIWGQENVVEFGFSNPTTLYLSTAGGGELSVEYPFSKNEWHHLAVVGDGNALHVYADLELIGSQQTMTDNYGSSGESFNIAGGGIFGDPEQPFLGQMDEVALFDRALTQEELASVFPGRPANVDQVSFAGAFSTDTADLMDGKSADLLIRIPFQVHDPSDYDQLSFRIQYDDGFVAYLNDVEILRENAPGEPGVAPALQATATELRVDEVALLTEEYDISHERDALVVGDNLLAVHGLNVSPTNPDFLVSVEMDALTFVPNPKVRGYMPQVTPGSDNNPTSGALGPLVSRMDHAPIQPAYGESVVVTTEVTPTLQDVAEVDLVYRVMHGGETVVRMVDDGSGDDAVAADGVLTATIPGGVAQPGEMLRWYVRTVDVVGVEGRLPLFQYDDEPTPEYFGTMIADPSLEHDVAVLHWFVADEAAAGGRGGTRASLFYDGEFYDNVFVRQRGGSTAGNSVGKTNFKFDFNGATFRFDPRYGRVEEFNLNTTATDKSYVRQPMSFEAYRKLGAPSSVSFPMHVRRNNEFYGVFVFIEEPSEEMLERSGLDPNGALYKMYNEFTNTGSARKKTRKNEDKDDLGDFIRNVNSLEGQELHNYLVDHVDLPMTLNYLVGTVLVHQNDNPHKNHFLYRDTVGTGEWMYLPWDNDLTWGSNWVGTSLHDIIYADVDQIKEGPKPSHDLSLIQPSHPLVNRQESREWNNHWNRLMNALLNDPVIRQMYLRRLRSGMDEFLGPPGTTDSYYDRRFVEHLSTLVDDAQLDSERWANPWVWGEDQSMDRTVEVIRQEYLEVRREHLYVTHHIDHATPPEIRVLLPEFTPATYWVPVDDSLETTWTLPDFDDSGWQAGSTGIGLPGADHYAELIRSTFELESAPPDTTSVLIRVPFTVDADAAIEDLTLRMKFDDGFVAYLNGVEVTRASLRTDGPQSYNSRARGRGNSRSLKFSNFLISDHVGLLKEGENILAIHGFNSSRSSRDMMFMPELIDGKIREVEIAGIPDGQIGNPMVTFDDQDFDANPLSGDQDEEYLKLDNPNEVAVDISGWRIDGGVELTFKPGTVIPAGSSLYVSPNVRAFRSRLIGPSGGQGRLVQGSYAGHLSSFGETVQLLAADGTLIDTIVTPAEPSRAQELIRVTEINYNSKDPNDGDEFIEIFNTSQSDSIDLAGLKLVAGPDEPLVVSEGLIGPREHRLFVRNVEAFQQTYRGVAVDLILGEFSGALSNQGERIKLDDVRGNTIVDMTFDDDSLWPAAADGVGSTLVLSDVMTTLREEMGKPDRWRASTNVGGTPGEPAVSPLGVVINEVTSNTPGTEARSDSIELKNTTDQWVDVSGWYLSDDANELIKFRIPTGVELPPGGFVVFNESDFNPTPNQPADRHFALNGGNGDEVWLSVTDETGNVNQLVDHVRFGASAGGESFGRWPDGQGRLAPMSDTTLGTVNTMPRVGPVVFSEVQYNAGRPSVVAFDTDDRVNSDDLEFVEIYNPTTETIDLTDWQIRGGIDFDFLTDTVLPPRGTLIITAFNPRNSGNADRLAAFVAHYRLNGTVEIVGGYAGQLSDSFDLIRLQRAVRDDDGTVVHYVEDELVYDDLPPWPLATDGKGGTLNRVDANAFGGVASSWVSKTPTPGAVLARPVGDYDGDLVVDAHDIDLLTHEIRKLEPDSRFDINGDLSVDAADRTMLVEQILQTSFGDANLDGVFDSHDFVFVFQLGEFNDGQVGNSTWAEGDWDGDGEFDIADIVFAQTRGQYHQPLAATPQSAIHRAVFASTLDDDRRRQAKETDEQLGDRESSYESLKRNRLAREVLFA